MRLKEQHHRTAKQLCSGATLLLNPENKQVVDDLVAFGFPISKPGADMATIANDDRLRALGLFATLPRPTGKLTLGSLFRGGRVL